jgi:hypothetical protein
VAKSGGKKGHEEFFLVLGKERKIIDADLVRN